MKTKYKPFLLMITVVLTFSGCEYDEDEIVQGYERAALPVVSDITSSYFNLLDMENAYVGFTLDKVGVPVRSITIQKTFKGQTVTHMEATQFPSSQQISLEDAISGFSGVSMDNLEVGDVVSFTFLVNTDDGRVFSSAVNFNAPLSCPSELAGVYEVFIVASNVTYTLSVSSLGAGQYQINNFNLDFQPDFYDTFTGLPIGASFADVCNEVTLNGTHDFGVQFRGVGSYDPEQDAIIFPSISDSGYGQGPWNNSGSGYVLKRVGQ